ncbi:MAG: trimethylamine methyltransferase family protein [Halodesulfurarchaeum sp.]
MDTLSAAATERLHEHALTLLAETGMQVEHEEARQVLDEAGGTVRDEVVTLPADLVERAIEDAPASFRWTARDPEKSVTVGAGDPVVTPIRGPRYVTRPGEDRHRATMADFEQLVALAHQEPAVDAVGYDICSPEGYSLAGNPGGFDQVDPGYDLLETLFTGSDKPIVATARSGPEAEASLEMARIAFDDRDPDLSEHVVLGILHVRSPRVLNEPMVSGLLAFARAGQPLVIASGAIPGASAPGSLSEAAVQIIAEALFGLTLAQVVNPGTPVVFGRAGLVYDRQAEAVTGGSEHGTALQAVTIEMASRYDLPVRGHGGVTDAKRIDHQSGAESAAHLDRALRSDADLLVCAAGGLDTQGVASPEKLVLDAARIREIRARRRESAALAAALESGPSLSTIQAGDPGQAFLDDRPPESLPDAPTFDDLAVRGSHEDWTETGSPSITDLATERVEELLAAYEQPPIDPAIEASLERAGSD